MWFMEMSQTIIIMIMMFSSYLLCMNMTSWILIWIFLEMNTLSFCSSSKINQKENKTDKTMESMMKYFIIQSISSMFLLFTATLLNKTSNFEAISLMLIILLMIKVASSPFQEWFIKMVKNMKSKNSFLLMSWQKIAPTYLVMYQMKIMMLPFALLSMVLGAVLQMNKKNTMEILGLSSVANLGWMLLTLLVNTFIFIMFTLIYWTSLILIMATILKNKIMNLEKNKTSQTSKIFIMMLIANLAGLPPTTGFLVKWMTLNEVMKTTKMLTLLVTLTLIVSILNFYIYLRLFTNLMMKAKEDSLKNKTFNTKLLFSSCLAFVFMPILLVS